MVKLTLNSYVLDLDEILKYHLWILSNLRFFDIEESKFLSKEIALILFPKNQNNFNKNINGEYLSKIQMKNKFYGLGEAIIYLIKSELVTYKRIIVNSAGLDYNDIEEIIKFMNVENEVNVHLIFNMKANLLFEDKIKDLSVLHIDDTNNRVNFNLVKD